MFDNHVRHQFENARTAPLHVSNYQVAEELLSRAQVALRSFEWLGRCGVSMAFCLFVVFLAMLSTTSLSAQTAGTVSGHVADPTGAAVPDADITLKNVGTGTERQTVTTGSGDYTFTEVPVGALHAFGRARGVQDRNH